MPFRAVPFVVRQFVPTECGLACISMICGTWGMFYNLKDVRKDLPAGRDGVSGTDVAAWLESHGFSCRRAVELSTNDGLGEYVYFVLLDDSHFVLVDSIRQKTVHLVDPAVGRYKVSHKVFLKRFTGYALRVGPASRRLASSSPLSRLVPLRETVSMVRLAMRRAGWLLHGLYLLVLIASLVPLFSSWLLSSVVNFASDMQTNYRQIWFLIGSFIIGTFIVVISKNFVMVKTNMMLGERLSQDFIDSVASSSLTTLRSFPGGDLVTRVGSIGSIRTFLVQTLIQTLFDAVSMCLYAIALVITLPLVGGIALAGVIVVGALGLVVGARQYSNSFVLAKAQADMNTSVFELLGNIDYVKMASQESSMSYRWHNIMAHYYNEERKVGVRQAYVDAIVLIVAAGFPAIALGVCVHLVESGQISLGVMVGVNALLSSVFTSSRGLLSSSDHFYSVGVALFRYMDLVDGSDLESASRKPIVRDWQRGSYTFSGEFEGIVLEHVGFCYPGSSSPVLTDVSCHFDAGKITGIVGATGSGKSTLLRVISGVESPTNGAVMVCRGGYSEAIHGGCGLLSLGVVTQDVSLFAGSIRDNIRLKSGELCPDDDDEIWMALDVACLGDEIRAMPMMLNTQLGEGGSGLSGGQKQRLCIARAVLGAPEVLIVDEGLSGCDLSTELAVISNLRDKKITVLLVTHRPYVADMCDRVYRLSDGSMGPQNMI